MTSKPAVLPAPMTPELWGRIRLIARSLKPCLILGESGTGKEVVARAIHRARAVGDFVVIDCGTMVGPLMESELFGHVRGAFTGADRPKEGLVTKADQGILFLDEIGDLPLELQVKLLRLIEEGTYRPVGSTERRYVNVRILAATHRDLLAMAAEGKFRSDLYYRLNVITLTLDPLRDRRSELPALIDFFLAKEGRPAISSAVFGALFRYSWPGNVRELANVISRMCALSEGLITLKDLPAEIAEPGVFDSAVDHVAAALAVAPPPDRLADLERAHILAVLARNQGDRQTTAAQLGINRTTLFRKLKEYGIGE